MLKIQQKHLQTISSHGESTYPEECCGLIIGEIAENCKIVTEIWQTENSWQPEAQELDREIATIRQTKVLSKRNRFSIAPQMLFQAQKSARQKNLAIIGIYHSHPDYPAQPSEFDTAIAWEQYSYIIVSVQQGQAVDLQSWTLDEQSQFQLEEILILESNNPKT